MQASSSLEGGKPQITLPVGQIYQRALVLMPSAEKTLFFSFFLFFFPFLFLVFLGQHLRHVEVPRLGVELELQPLAYAVTTATWDPSHICDLHTPQLMAMLDP